MRRHPPPTSPTMTVDGALCGLFGPKNGGKGSYDIRYAHLIGQRAAAAFWRLFCFDFPRTAVYQLSICYTLALTHCSPDALVSWPKHTQIEVRRLS